MRKDSLVRVASASVFALGMSMFSSASAESLAVPADASAPTAPMAVPQRGDSQAAVLRHFGEPVMRHAPTGGGAPRQPPITRWDYAGFSVFFERHTVIDVVIKDQPAPLSHIEELQPPP